ncbi:HWE histidine kinase domain-containing protein [Rhizobium sp. 18065]|uniref:sensor histidine kinase n=1 Tax=Rhizobium sp. 18065 TaxID=2681411 RepID=UPI00135CE642|nr:HWE histidine kinase domain-containing protein [Rhizobium sp. 18065]
MKKRLFAVVLTALTPTIGMLAYNEIAARSERSVEVHRHAAQMARQGASDVGSVIDGIKGILIATSAIPAVAERDPASCNVVLRSVASKLAPIRNILVLDRDGKLVCDSMGWEAGTNFADRDYVQRALNTDGLVIGNYTIARVSDAPILPVAIALKQGAETVGVLATGVRLEWLQDQIQARGVAPGGAMTIADGKGVILARDPEPDKFVGTTIPNDYRHLITAQAPGTTEVLSQDGTRRIMGYIPVSARNPLYVSAGLSQDVAFAPINRATLTGLVMTVIGTAMALGAAVFVGNQFILGPINHIVQVLERWRDGDSTARTLMMGRHGELGQVGASVDRLLDELEVRRCESARAEEKRRLLAKELTHRVKNTLAIVQAIARQTYRNLAEQNAVFANRVGALGATYDILMTDDRSAAEIAKVVERALLPVCGGVERGISISGPKCLLEPEAVGALSMVVHELATNALKYGALNHPNGRVRIEWEERDGRIDFFWQELDGPAVVPPSGKGFGSTLISSAFPMTMEPETKSDFAPDGLKFRLSFRAK